MDTKTTEQQPVGHCTECSDPLYVGDKARIAYSPTAPGGLEFTCDACLLAVHGAVIPADESVH